VASYDGINVASHSVGAATHTNYSCLTSRLLGVGVSQLSSNYAHTGTKEERLSPCRGPSLCRDTALVTNKPYSGSAEQPRFLSVHASGPCRTHVGTAATIKLRCGSDPHRDMMLLPGHTVLTLRCNYLRMEALSAVVPRNFVSQSTSAGSMPADAMMNVTQVYTSQYLCCELALRLAVATTMRLSNRNRN
jgi:hypothetical protein